MNDLAMERKVGVGKVTSMARVTGLESSYRYVCVGSRSIVHDGASVTYMGHPTAPYPSLGSGPSHSIDLGDLPASPRWSFRRWAPPNPSQEGEG